MATPTWRVVVVRAWRDAEGLRIRVIAHDHPGQQWIVRSVPACCEVLEGLFDELTRSDTPEATNG